MKSSSSLLSLGNKALLLAAIFLFSSSAGAVDVNGDARILDGDTVAIQQTKIRLEGVDAPETNQICLNSQGARWACGVEARDQLTRHIAGRPVSCVSSGEDAYHRTLATCFVGREDLNAWLVREGWALAFIRYSDKYSVDEEDARKARRGLWAGAFIAPWDWRHGGNPQVLGASSVPTNSRHLLLSPAAVSTPPSAECTIKGNVNRKGERIYHLAGSSHYGKVNMSSGDKRWFCSEEEAQAAGWRPPAR